MKICGILHTLNKHGGVRRYFEIGNELVKQGHDFTLFADRDERQESIAWMDFRGNIRPRSEYKNEKYDIAFTGAWECFDDLINIRADKKIVLVVAKFYKDKYIELWNRVGDNGYRWIGVAKDWNKGMEEINGELISGGVNTEFFKPKWVNKNNRKLTVCFYGRLGDGRGATILKEEIDRLKNRFNIIIFDSPNYTHLESPDYKATPSQEDLLEVYQNSDIVLSYMRSAGWNNVIAEGMACGCVPIGTEAGTKDQIINGETGFTVNNLTELASRLLQLDENRSLLILMREKAYKHIQQYNWINFVKRLIDTDGVEVTTTIPLQAIAMPITSEVMPKEVFTTHTPELSVIVPIFNAPNTDDTLESLILQTLDKSKYEVIFILSNPDNIGVTESKINNVKYKHNLPYTILKGININNCTNRNLAVSKCSGSRVLFLDGDQLFHKELFKKHYECQDPVGIGIINIHINIHQQRKALLPPLTTNKWGFTPIEMGEGSIVDFTNSLKLSSAIGLAMFHNKDNWTDYINFIPRNCSIDKKIFIDVGGFDTEMGYSPTSKSRGWEDVELGLRLYENKIKFGFVPSWAIHINHSSMGKDGGWGNMIYMVKKHKWFLTERPDWFSNNLYDIEEVKKKCMGKLDLGCGIHKNPEHIGIDIGSENNPDLVHDLTKGIPYEDNSVDGIYSAHFLEHLTECEIVSLINEIYRVCKKGVRINIIVPLNFPDKAHKIIFNYDWLKYWSLDKFAIRSYNVKVINATTFNEPHTPFTYEEGQLILEKI